MKFEYTADFFTFPTSWLDFYLPLLSCPLPRSSRQPAEHGPELPQPDQLQCAHVQHADHHPDHGQHDITVEPGPDTQPALHL